MSQQTLDLPRSADQAAIAAALASGRSATSAASVAGVSVQTALVRARLAGFEVKLRPKRVKGELRRRIEDELAKGKPVGDVARWCKVSLSTVYRVQQGSPALGGVARARIDQAREVNLAERQKRWFTLKSAHPTLSVSELRRLAPADYAFLYRHSRHWLEANKPDLKPVEPVGKGARTARAPEGADFALARRLQQTADEVPRQRTAGALLLAAGRRDAPVPSPTTEKMLERHVESWHEYTQRRLHEAAAQLYDSGHPVVPWLVMRHAGIREETLRASSVDVDAVISGVLEEALRKI